MPQLFTRRSRAMRRGHRPRRPGGTGDCPPEATARAWCFLHRAQATQGGDRAHEKHAADPLARIQELLAFALVAELRVDGLVPCDRLSRDPDVVEAADRITSVHSRRATRSAVGASASRNAGQSGSTREYSKKPDHPYRSASERLVYAQESWELRATTFPPSVRQYFRRSPSSSNPKLSTSSTEAGAAREPRRRTQRPHTPLAPSIP